LGLPDGSNVFLNEETGVHLQAERELELLHGEIYLEVAHRVAGTKDAPFRVHTPVGDVTALGTKFSVRDLFAKQGHFLKVIVTQGQVKASTVADPISAGQQLAPRATAPTPAPRTSHELGWTRDLMIAAETPLVPGSRFAGGAIVAVDPYGQEAQLSLRKYHVDVHVEGGIARTTIDQTFFNASPARMEGTFYFPLPPDASLSRLAMYVDGQLMEGGMAEHDYARQVYETIRYTQRDPALLEWVDGSTFKMRVFPLEGRQEKRIILSYSQRLESLYSGLHYRFPAGHSLQRVDQWSFHARIKGGSYMSWHSPTHALKDTKRGSDLFLDAEVANAALDHDLVLDLNDEAGDGGAARFSSSTQDGTRYLMLRYRPILSATEHRPPHRHWVFLFESSGDRDPLLARVQIDVLRALLDNVDSGDTFAVLTAGTRVRSFGRDPLPVTPDNVRQAVEFLEHTRLIGALDLGRALAETEPFLKAGANACLVHLGTGIAAMGERRDDVLARRVSEGVPYVGIGVGKRWARSFMKAAAERSGGYFTQINPDEPAAWRAFELLATLNTPRLLDARVIDNAERVTFLMHTTALAQGEELCAVAKLDGDQPLPESVTVSGLLDGQPFRQVLPLHLANTDADYLLRTWAKLEIDRLLAEDAKKHKDRIVALSKATYVMTPFTSLLVLENESMYQQYKVDRGRKDHWAMYACPDKIPVVVEPDPDQPGKPEQKPTVNQVLQTILVRRPARILNWPNSPDPFHGQAVMNAKDLAAGGQGVHAVSFNPDGRAQAAAASSPNDKVTLWSTSAQKNGDAGGRGYTPPDPLVPFALWHDRPESGVPFMASEFLFLQQSNLLHHQVIARRGQIDFDGSITASLGGIALSSETPTDSRRLTGLSMDPNLPLSQTSFGPAIPPTGGYPIGVGPVIVMDGSIRTPGRDLSLQGQPIGGSGPSPSSGWMFMPGNEQSWQNGFWGEPPLYAVNRIEESDKEFAEIQKGVQTTPTGSLLFGKGVNADAGLQGLVWDMATGKTTGIAGLRPPLYQRPSFSGDERIFTDLVAYAPGMNTSRADILTVVEAEALPIRRTAPGRIDAGARVLIDRARDADWQALTSGNWKVTFNGQGHFISERTLPLGLHERVICDGGTMLHLYSELGIGARRRVSRFHRAEFAAVVPWVLPPAEDLAHDADMRCLDDRTVALIPRDADTTRDADGKPVSYLAVHLVFASGGRLAARRVVEMPSGKTLYRQTYDGEGGMKLMDRDGKVLRTHQVSLRDASAPDLNPDVENLVVLPLPLRTADHVRQTRNIKPSQGLEDYDTQTALALFAAQWAAQNSTEAVQQFGRRFHIRNIRPLGFYTLLASAGINVDAEQQYLNVLADHPGAPLAEYLAFHTNPELRRHAHRGELAGPPDGFLQRLAAFRVLYNHWQNGLPATSGAAERQTAREQALGYVRHNRDTLLGWALLGLLQDKDRDPRFQASLAEACRQFENTPDLAYPAQYERARCLWNAGQRRESRTLFHALYSQGLKSGTLPPIDQAFRQALQGMGGDAEEWAPLMQKTAASLARDGRRLAVVALAWQCWHLGDQPVADHLLAIARNGIEDQSERLAVTLAEIDLLLQNQQPARADQLVQPLLADAKLATNASLWRLGQRIAEQLKQPARALACLEKSLEIEYRLLPAVIDLQSVRTDYGALMGHYQRLVDAMMTLQVTPPSDFAAKVLSAADRWRALDRDGAGACQAAASILRSLGERDLAWEYMTTPIGIQPNESGPWLNLAQTERGNGDFDLADRAYTAAFEAEPTNAQILWDRAQALQQSGKTAEARMLYRQIVERHWQPRFASIQAQARWQVEP
jgi:tetratricopeptide (TPR) repeat protein